MRVDILPGQGADAYNKAEIKKAAHLLEYIFGG
jgi:hypothetical protein